jgi:hypothetical protein
VHASFIVEESIGMGVVPDEGIDLDHFAVDNPRPIFTGHPAEWKVGTASERGI